jgi:hypothetical protein
MRKLGAATKRLLLESLGWLLVVAGIAALVLPGPGLLMLFAGLVILSQQYDWAEKRLEPIKERALKAAAEGVETWPRIVVSSGIAAFLILCGVVWIWSPPAPSWWPLDDGWWLIGGIGTGITQIASGLIALGTIAWSYRQFRVGATA